METIQVNEIEKAKQLLKEDEKKRIQSFIQEYTELVKKRLPINDEHNLFED
jgi:hypothetical protein